jgi:hypothetical protein
MKLYALVATILVAGLTVPSQAQDAAKAGEASGQSALALASIVASHGSLGAFDKRAILALNRGKRLVITRVNKIPVAANSIVCTARSCELTFKTYKRKLTGRAANEVYRALAMAGIKAEEAAGSTTERITNLECTIDPAQIEKSGQGTSCTFEAGQ